jgi:hypothetical protein
VLESFAHANATSKSRDKNPSDLNSARPDLTAVSAAQRTLEKAFSALTVDIAKRFDEVLDVQKQKTKSVTKTKAKPRGLDSIQRKPSGGGRQGILSPIQNSDQILDNASEKHEAVDFLPRFDNTDKVD